MRFGVREICNVVFKAATTRQIGTKEFAAGAPVIYFDSLKTSTMEQATTTVYAQGGRGNVRLIAWEGEKTLTFTMEDALISEMGLAILAGAHLYEAKSATGGGNTDGNTLIIHVSETVEAITENTTAKVYVSQKGTMNTSKVQAYAMALDDKGNIDGDPIKVDVATSGSNNKYAVTASTGATFSPVAGKVYIIDYYTDKTTGAYQVDIEPECFGGNFYIEADTLFRDTDGADHAAQFIIPNGKIQSNFTFSMASSGDPSTFTFTVDAFPGYVNGDKTKKVLSSIQIIKDNFDVAGTDDAAGDEDTYSI